MNRRITGAGLALAITAAFCSPVSAQTAASAPIGLAIAPPLVPADFKVPTLAEAPDFKLVPLGPACQSR